MEVKNTEGILGTLLNRHPDIEPERVQLFVFLAQTLGEPFGYAFDVRHFRVFSEALEADVSSLTKQTHTVQSSLSDTAKFVCSQVLSNQLEQLQLAAALIYFQRKGYSASEIEHVLNPEEELLRTTHGFLAKLQTFKTKELVPIGGS